MANVRFLGGGLLTLLMLVVFVGCTSSPYSRSTGEYVGDQALAAKVKAELVRDPVTKAHQIQVETFRGVVQLSGFVDTQESIKRATEIAQGVEGVDQVKNNMVVKEMRQQEREREKQ